MQRRTLEPISEGSSSSSDESSSPRRSTASSSARHSGHGPLRLFYSFSSSARDEGLSDASVESWSREQGLRGGSRWSLGNGSGMRISAKDVGLARLTRHQSSALSFIAPKVKRMSVVRTHFHVDRLASRESDGQAPAERIEINPDDAGASLTAAERTHWLITFVELIYVASMIKLGHYLEYERSSWYGWLAALAMFCSFWTTWLQFTAYQTFIVDQGILEKVWAFVHCFTMLMMGGYVDSLHYCSTMAKKIGEDFVCQGYDINGGRIFSKAFYHSKEHYGDDAGKRMLAAGSGYGTYLDYQVQQPFFLLGLALSRLALSTMYGIAALSSAPRFRRPLRVANLLFAISFVALLASALATTHASSSVVSDHSHGISVDHTVLVIFGVLLFELVGLHLLARAPHLYGVSPADVNEMNEECDIEHVAHNLGQFLFIVIGEITINTISFIGKFSTFDGPYIATDDSSSAGGLQPHPHSLYMDVFDAHCMWPWVLAVLVCAFLLAVGYFDSVPHHHALDSLLKGDDQAQNNATAHRQTTQSGGASGDGRPAAEEENQKEKGGDKDADEDVRVLHVGGDRDVNVSGSVRGSPGVADDDVPAHFHAHALAHSYSTSVVWILCHVGLGFSLLHVSAGFNEMLTGVYAQAEARHLAVVQQRQEGGGDRIPPLTLHNTLVDSKAAQSVCAGVAFSLWIMQLIRISHKGWVLEGHKGRAFSYACRMLIAGIPCLIYCIKYLPSEETLYTPTKQADPSKYHWFRLFVPVLLALTALTSLCIFDRAHRSVASRMASIWGGGDDKGVSMGRSGAGTASGGDGLQTETEMVQAAAGQRSVVEGNGLSAAV